VSKSVECVTFLFSALTLLVGDGNDLWPVKSYAWVYWHDKLTGALHILQHHSSHAFSPLEASALYDNTPYP